MCVSHVLLLNAKFLVLPHLPSFTLYFSRFSPEAASRRGLSTAEMNAVEAIHRAVEFNPHVPKVRSSYQQLLHNWLIAVICNMHTFPYIFHNLCCRGKMNVTSVHFKIKLLYHLLVAAVRHVYLFTVSHTCERTAVSDLCKRLGGKIVNMLFIY